MEKSMTKQELKAIIAQMALERDEMMAKRERKKHTPHTPLTKQDLIQVLENAGLEVNDKGFQLMVAQTSVWINKSNKVTTKNNYKQIAHATLDDAIVYLEEMMEE